MLIIHVEFMSWFRDEIGSILDLFKLLQIPAILGAEGSSRPEGQLSQSFKKSLDVSVLQGVDVSGGNIMLLLQPLPILHIFSTPRPSCLFCGGILRKPQRWRDAA